MERKKKLKLIQLSLLIFGILIIYITYYNKDSDLDKEFFYKPHVVVSSNVVSV